MRGRATSASSSSGSSSSSTSVSTSSGSSDSEDDGPLPDGWFESVDSRGRRYFYDSTTKRSSWHRPASAPLPGGWYARFDEHGRRYYWSADAGSTWHRPAAMASAPLPSGWYARFDEHGRRYYWSADAGSTWLRPDAAPAVPVPSVLPGKKAAQPAGAPPPSAAVRRKKARPPSGAPPPSARCPRHRKKTLRVRKSCRVAVGTWNIGAELPTHRMLCRYFEECAVEGAAEPTPDVWILGFQETVELSPQNIVMGASNPGCNARTGELVVACEAAINALFGANEAPASSGGGLLTKDLGAKQRAAGECSFIYRYILRESCSQFDSLPLTSLTISP